MSDELDQAQSAFMKADAAGDTASAKILAGHVRELMAQKPATPEVTKPETAPTPKTVKSVATDVGLSASAGAVIGAFTPEIMQGVGAALEFGSPLFGPAAPLAIAGGAALATAGTALKVARLATVFSGFVSGAASETAGQAAEMLGAKEGGLGATAARLAGGFGTELIGLVPKAGKLAFKTVQALAGKEATEAAVKNNLKSLMTSDAPEHDAYEAIKKGIDATQEAAKQAEHKTVSEAYAKAAKMDAGNVDAAKRITAQAEAEGARIRAEAKAQANVLNKAADGKLQTATRIKAMAEPELAKVGEAKHMTDIGNSLRTSMTEENQKLVAARAAGYQKAHGEVAAIAQQKEAAGIFPSDLPAMKTITDGLEKKLLNTPEGVAAAKGGMTIGDPSLKAANKQLYDAITPKQVPTGKMGPDGKEIIQTVKPTFESLRQTSRALGQRAYGSVETGFSAIGQNEAKALQKQIDQVLTDHVGAQYPAMQAKYAQESGDLAKYKTSAGKAATAVDRIDPESYLKDAASVPDKYFKTSTGVKDAIELTGGNKELVHREAANFSRHEMTGMSSTQAKAWIAKNGDWLREIPGLTEKNAAYATQLKRIEDTAANLQKAATRRTTEAAGITQTADKAAQQEAVFGRAQQEKTIGSNVDQANRIRDDATKGAAATREATVKDAQVVAKNGFAGPEMKKLLLTGNREDTQAATRALIGNPGGQEAVGNTLISLMSKMTPAQLTDTYQNRISVMLKDGQLIPPKTMAKLDAQVKDIIAKNDAKEANTLVVRAIRKALTSGASAVIPSTASLYN